MTLSTDIRSAPATQPYKWTIERYHQAVNAGIFAEQNIELLNGEIVLMPPEGAVHAARDNMTIEYLRYLLGSQVQIREGKLVTLPSADSEPESDVAIVEPLFWEYVEHHPYAENIFWLIEFSKTTLKKDLEFKDKTYAQAGIQEYWVVDLNIGRLIVFRDPMDSDYQSKQTLYHWHDLSRCFSRRRNLDRCAAG